MNMVPEVPFRPQYRVSYRFPDWPANKSPNARIFRQRPMAEDFGAEMQAKGAQIIIEERKVYSTPWATLGSSKNGNVIGNE